MEKLREERLFLNNTVTEDKSNVLKKYFGYSSFRGGQEDIINNILIGKDTLGVMPTGAGKSICFQVPALMFSGMTVVISPLISLMKDQVEALKENNIKAEFINSALTLSKANVVLKKAIDGECKILYVAPERLEVPEFVDAIKNANISMVAVDEAHCVSQWGQDFRPSYLVITEFIEKLKKRPVVSAFTATATDEVREDIIRILKLKDPFVLTTGYNRSNLYFEVQKPKNKYDAVVKYLKTNPDKCGIIYCLTRKTVEEVADKLVKDGYNAAKYHAGLNEKERQINQDDFIYDRKTIMVATNAFGMGIDKSNVSYVIHYNMPKDIESYYQEAGRAGRDGTDAECILLYEGRDVVTNTFLIDNADDNPELEPEVVERIKEKERARLKSMTYYCHTADCLREYILKYFGDSSSNFCGNCGNCNTNFEEKDITEEAKKVLSCVYRLRERYGIKVLTDTLRGSTAEKILRLGLNKLSTYGIMADYKENRVRDIINFLVLNDYLYITDSEYPVVRLTGKAKDVLFDGVRLTMKLVKDIEVPVRKVKEEVSVNNDLLTRLKKLRLEIAKKEKVPAFIVFSDATLIDMCRKMPVTEHEFLEISGVGRAKLGRYGREFINEITEFCQ